MAWLYKPTSWTPYLPIKWHLIPNVFIYLFYFIFPTYRQWVVALKISLLSFTTSHKTPDPSVLDKIFWPKLILWMFCCSMCTLAQNGKPCHTGQTTDDLNWVGLIWTLWVWNSDNDELSLFNFNIRLKISKDSMVARIEVWRHLAASRFHGYG